MERRKLARAILRSMGVGLVLTMFFGVFALISPSGYKVQARVNSIDRHYELSGTSDYIFAVVNYNCNASFNPLLYPLSWLIGRGYLSGDFSTIYLPYWTTQTTPQGEQYNAPVWGKPEDIENEATMKVILEEFLINLPILPAVFFVIELAGKRSVYLWFLGGTAGFALGSIVGTTAGLLIGTGVGFFFMAFLTTILLPKLRGRGTLKVKAAGNQTAEI